MFTYHQWASNLSILDVNEVKSIPNTPYSHPFIERLISTILRNNPNQTVLWNAEIPIIAIAFHQK